VKPVARRAIALPGGHSALALRSPLQLLDDAHGTTRDRIVAVSDRAFGTSTEPLWRQKFTSQFLRVLTRFYLINDARGALVGWSGYRAATIEQERVVYFTSTGLLECCQGRGLVSALQRSVVSYEAMRHPLRPITRAVRTRNPHSYRLALRHFGDRPLAPAVDGRVAPTQQHMVTAVGRWLDLDIDPATAIVHDAYDIEDSLYGLEPRTADPNINALFEALNPHDALLVLGGHTRTNALRFALRLDAA